MPRSRGSEMPQRQSARGPPHLRTSSSDSDPVHHRSMTGRSPKLGDRRSPRGVQSDPTNQRKLGTRIAGLETQLDQAQVELKVLKEQLASAEAAKKEAQQQLKKKAMKRVVPEPEELQEKHSCPTETLKSNKKIEISENQPETDVFEVPVGKLSVEPKIENELCKPTDQDELNIKSISISTDPPAISEPEKPAMKNDEINLLKSAIEAKENEIQVCSQENENLKSRLNEATSDIASARAKEEEMTLKLGKLGQELEASRGEIVQLNEKLESVEGAKEALETEMKKLRVQTEQWRKAADAAAAVLAGDMDMNNGRRISERCGSMDKDYGSDFEASAGSYAGYVGSPGLGDDSDDGFGSGKRKGSGLRMFGDLWKKKGQK